MHTINATQATLSVRAASRTLDLHEYTTNGDAYDRLSQRAGETDTAGRIEIATAGYLIGTAHFRSSRAFDNCFENGDGDHVVAALVERAERNPALHRAIAADFSGTFPAKWIETAGKISGRQLAFKI
jgi:hypothetical protein